MFFSGFHGLVARQLPALVFSYTSCQRRWGQGGVWWSQIRCQVLSSSLRIQFPGKSSSFMRPMNGTFPLTLWNIVNRIKAGYLRMPVVFPAGIPLRQSLVALFASGPCCEATGLNLRFLIVASLHMWLVAGHPEGTIS